MKQLNYKYALGVEGTRQRLREWGNWYHATLSMGLNFSSKSIVGQLIDSQGVLIRSTGEYLAPENEKAEEIDQLINDLSKENEKVARVLCYHYTEEGSRENKVLHSGVPKTSYYRILSNAEKWIHERL